MAPRTIRRRRVRRATCGSSRCRHSRGTSGCRNRRGCVCGRLATPRASALGMAFSLAWRRFDETAADSASLPFSTPPGHALPHMIDTLHGWITAADAFVWGPPLLILLFGTHLFLTFRLRFIQRYMLHGDPPLARPREKGAGRRQPVRRAHHRARRHDRHRQHRRRRDRGRLGGPGRGALDVADRRLRHRDQVRRSAARREVPRHAPPTARWRAARCTCSSAASA